MTSLPGLSSPPSTGLPIDGLLVSSTPAEGKPRRNRIASAQKALEIYHKLQRADLSSSLNRVAIQSMFDGAPPYDEAHLRNTGQGNRCNMDFGEGSELLEKAMSAYVDLLYSVENLITVKTRYGDVSQREEWNDIIAEEWSRMVRAWPGFDHAYLYNCLHFIIHGVSICFFENELDWRWKVSPFGDFLIPRRTLANQDELEVACAARSFPVHKLYSFIENAEEAKEQGWNVELVREAIADAQPVPQTVTHRDWEKLQSDLKNNDIHYGVTSSEVKLIHVWVKEFDGQVSHYMVLENDKAEEFVYKKENRFASMDQAFQFFTYGIGTNGHYHGIRGLGYKVFPMVQYSNRLLSQEMDSAMLSSSVMIQPESDEAMDNLQLINYGPYAVVSPGMNFVERAVPDLGKSVEPALNRIASMVQRRAGQYTNNIFDDKTERTRFEVAAHLDYLAKLSVTSLNLFYAPWGRLLREVFRRTIRKDYVSADPGGQPVVEFRRRCFERGVPKEAIFACDIASVREVRAVGAGSAAARQLVFNDLTEMATQFDDTGRRKVLRQRVASRVGWENVDQYVPPMEGPRPTSDDRFAVLENAMMEKGSEMPVYSNDIHPIHARVHLARLNEMVQAVERGETLIEEATPIMVLFHAHATEHVEAMSADATTGQEAAMHRQNLQQTGEIIFNGIKHIQKLQRERQAAQPNGPDGQPAGPTPEELDQAKWSRGLERQLLEHQTKLQMMQETHAQNMALKAAEAAQKRALADAEVAAKLRRGSL